LKDELEEGLVLVRWGKIVVLLITAVDCLHAVLGVRLVGRCAHECSELDELARSLPAVERYWWQVASQYELKEVWCSLKETDVILLVDH